MNKVNRIVLLLLLFCLPSLANEKSRFGRDVSRLLILGGELSNSAATSVADIDEVMPRMAALGLNTVLVPAYWDLIEPVAPMKTICKWFSCGLVSGRIPCPAMPRCGLSRTRSVSRGR